MDVLEMKFSKVYPLLIAKAVRKGHSPEEVFEVTRWLTGYSFLELDNLLQSDTSYGDFLRNAPSMNPERFQIRGSICGIRVENIEDPLMRDLRILDKLVDDLAKGKSLEKIIGKTI